MGERWQDGNEESALCRSGACEDQMLLTWSRSTPILTLQPVPGCRFVIDRFLIKIPIDRDSFFPLHVKWKRPGGGPHFVFSKSLARRTVKRTAGASLTSAMWQRRFLQTGRLLALGESRVRLVYSPSVGVSDGFALTVEE
jgi:hypothetical protein